MNKSALISQLKIDRDERRPRAEAGPPVLLWVGIGVLALAAVGALVWFLIARPDVTRVRVAEAKPAAVGASAPGGSLLDASGYVVARRAATVSSKITGKVMEVMIEEGQQVQAGQILARLDDSNARASLAQAEANASASEANMQVANVGFEQAGRKYERSQKLFVDGYVSEQAREDSKAAYDTARNNLELVRRQAVATRAGRDVARRNLDDTVVRAPFGGVVTIKAAQPGEMVSPVSAGGGYTRTGIGAIVDMDSLEVQVDVAESFINRVHAGMPALVKLNAYPTWEIPAEVIAVIPTADRSKATVAVRVGLKVHDARIVPEMGARVAFLNPTPPAGQTSGPARKSVIAPVEAVEPETADQGVVFVVQEGKLERRAVRLGTRSPEGQTILAGVSPGEQLAKGDLAKLKDGQKVRIDTSPEPEPDDDQ